MELSSKKPEIPENVKKQWQRIVDLMAKMVRVPAGLIMRTDPPQIEVFTSSNTKGNPYRVGERANLNTGLYCETVMKEQSPLLVCNATKDPNWDKNPDIELGMTYYFGFPVLWPDGEVFGTICVLDKKDNPQATACRELLSEFKAVIERDLLIVVENKNREKLLNALELHRTRLEQMVTEQAGEWQITFDAVQDMIMILDKDFRILRVNKSTMSFLGQPLEQILEKPYYTLMYGTDAPLSDCPVAKASRSKQHEEGEIYLERKNIWLLTSVDPIVDDKGDIVGFIKFFKDTTERKQAEKLIKESEERLNEAQRMAHLGNWELNLITNTLFWSDEIFRIFEIDKERFGASYEYFLSVIHPDDREMVNTAYTQSLKTRKPYDITHRLLMPNGRVKYVHERCETFYSPDGRPLRSVGTVQDITEQKRSEKEVFESRETLRAFAGMLLTIQEDERRRLARELHDDFTQRLAILALNITKLMRKSGPASDLFSNDLKNIKEEVIKLSTDIHDISRQLHPSIIDDIGLVRAIESECRNFTKHAGIPIKYAPEYTKSNTPKDVSICLFRITQEALRNIGKHSKANKAEVALTESDNKITLTIKDYGGGFNSDRLEGKRGLGLVSMRERARLCQGDLVLKSAPGQGTEIKVTIPLASHNNG